VQRKVRYLQREETMKKDGSGEMRKFHKQMAIELFNGTWDLLDNPKGQRMKK